MSSESTAAKQARRFLQWVNEPGDDDQALSLADLAELAAAYADTGFARIDGAKRAEKLACRRGCDWCCYLPVQSSLAEAVRALEFARRTLDPEAFGELAGRIRLAAAAYPPSPKQPLSKSPPCPFLLNGDCQIYPARPLACRGWTSLDAGACETAWREGVHGVKVPVDARIHGVYANAAEAFFRALGRDGRGESLHLVPALVIALDASGAK